MNKQDVVTRLIEVDFPLKKVSEESVCERNIRHGHISTLHIWWAQRPFHREPDLGMTSVKYNVAELLARSQEPV